MNQKFYSVCWCVLRPLFDLLYPRRVQGLENLPAEGGFILCINHMSALDPLYISTRIPRRRNMYFLCKKEVFDVPLLGRVVRGLGGIPVDRGHADLNAVRTAMKVLKEGFGLGIFPQGTRSRDNRPTPMLNGASMIALRGGVPVIPAYIDGPYRLFRRSDIFFGAPLDLSEYGRRCDAQILSEVTARIERAVWSLKGPK